MSEGMIATLFGRLNRARLWVLLQFVLTLVFIFAGLAWTRLPDKHIWQVALSLLVPVLLLICALELEAGTVRKLADDDGKRVKLLWGAMAMLVWVAVGAAAWALRARRAIDRPRAARPLADHHLCGRPAS